MTSTDTRAAFIAQHNARTDYRHPIVMPNAARWSDLFAESIPWQVDKLHNVIGLTRPIPVVEGDDWRSSGKRKRTIRMPVGPYLTFDGREGARGSAAVIPTEATLAAVAASTIVIERDSMFFKVIEWAPEEDGSRLCLVTCDHNQIIGGIWLAVIEASELPAFLMSKGE